MITSLSYPLSGLAVQTKNELPKQQHRTSDAPFLTPQQAVKKMAIPDGFEVSVFASEPDIAEPIAFCFDHKGRLWIAENFNYQTRRKHSDDPVSRIQIFEDTDGNGVFDKKKTFTDKLTFTSGLACGFGGVFVGSPPNLSFIPDANGDDIPDGPPEVLLNGWGINDRHETLNSFIWGPDGWLYGCHGVFTQSNVGAPGAKDRQRQFIDGGIWRFHPTRKKFEVFARGLSNPWGFDFDDHGQGFATCCVIPHLFHIVQGGVYHKQSRPHVNPYIFDDIKTIRDHTHLSAHGGARFYLADAFPAPYNDRRHLFMCNIHEHAVLTDVMERNGSSFIGRHGDDFMPTNDLAWVGFSVEMGPEGGVYLLDWHDTDVCGNAVNFPNSGRVYRIMPKDADPVPRPDLSKLDDLQLVQLQTHNNDWYVRHSRTLLQYRASLRQLDSAAQQALKDLFDQAESSPKRLRALWASFVTGGLKKQQLVDLLEHDDEYVRAWAIQLLTDDSPLNAFQLNGELTAVYHDANVRKKQLMLFERLAHEDPSPVVRLYLASAAQRLTSQYRWGIFSGLLAHKEDNDDNNIPRMIWFGLEPLVPEFPERSLKLVCEGQMPKLQEFVARRLATSETVVQSKKSTPQQRNRTDWQWTLQRVAPGFHVHDVGEKGVVHHRVFRNRTAVQTHPLDKETPCQLTRKLKIRDDGSTHLKMCVSHHPHGDWKLNVRVNERLVATNTVSSSTVDKDEWLVVQVDLTKFAGQTIDLAIENEASDWMNEWAYWNRVEIVNPQPSQRRLDK
ncbi:MAG: PVC-type heme-binding CxxCH protein [Planctomycetota bacterium]